MFRILKDYIYTFMGLLVAAATMHGFFNSFFPSLSKDARFAVVFIVVLFIWSFVYNLYIKTKWGRKRKYAETISNITNGFSGIHKLTRDSEITIKSAIHACERLCTEISTAYTVITGTKCNVVIKMLEKDKDEDNNTKLKVISFARSNDLSRNPKINSVKHWIDKNTDFYNILEKIDQPKRNYFFSNSLPLRFGYLNTSFSVYGESKSEPDPNILLRYWRWSLPYKSTIVVPICPCDEPSKNTLLGFLCVDSTNIGAFKKDYDVALLNGVADGIYNLIKEISKIDDNNIII